MSPVRHALGALLLEQGQADAAAKVYRDDLKRNPNNVWSLTGLVECLAAHDVPSVDDDELPQCQRALDDARQFADGAVQFSCACRGVQSQ